MFCILYDKRRKKENMRLNTVKNVFNVVPIIVLVAAFGTIIFKIFYLQNVLYVSAKLVIIWMFYFILLNFFFNVLRFLVQSELYSIRLYECLFLWGCMCWLSHRSSVKNKRKKKRSFSHFIAIQTYSSC